MGEALLIFFIVLLIIIVAIVIIRIPIIIAKKRNIIGSELTTIAILSWLGLLVGITWIIALVLSLTYKPMKWVNKDENEDIDLDKLEKLHDLEKKGIINEEEYNQERAKIIKKSGANQTYANTPAMESAISSVKPSVDSTKNQAASKIPALESQDASQWYFAEGDEHKGPVSQQEIQNMLLNNRLNASSLVWRTGLSEWVNLGDTELKNFISPLLPPPLPPKK